MPTELQGVGVLKGHKSAVVGLCVASAGDAALSSSEDGTLRLWDLRTRRGVRAIIAVPPESSGSAKDDPCGALGSCAFVNPSEPYAAVLVASGSALLAYDLRGSNQVVCKGPPSAKASASDDINDFAVSPDGSIVAAPCDEGTIELFSTMDLKPLRTLKGGHQNICGVARFRADGNELLSGGFDQQVLLWDPSSGKLRSKYEVRELLPADDPEGESNPNQLVNPPFVLGFASGGVDDSLGVALGDGGILVLPGGRRPHRGEAPWAVPQAHAAATDAVSWLGPGSPLLASLGRDRILRIWNVDLNRGRGSSGSGGKRNKGGSRGGAAAGAAGYAGGDGSSEAVEPRFPAAAAEMGFADKPNALAAGRDVVLVADTSSEVKVLQVVQ